MKIIEKQKKIVSEHTIDYENDVICEISTDLYEIKFEFKSVKDDDILYYIDNDSEEMNYIKYGVDFKDRMNFKLIGDIGIPNTEISKVEEFLFTFKDFDKLYQYGKFAERNMIKNHLSKEYIPIVDTCNIFHLSSATKDLDEAISIWNNSKHTITKILGSDKTPRNKTLLFSMKLYFLFSPEVNKEYLNFLESEKWGNNNSYYTEFIKFLKM